MLFNQLQRWPESTLPWRLLGLSALGLLATALYFQHVLDLQPCIKCIYQRTAVVGILISALLPSTDDEMGKIMGGNWLDLLTRAGTSTALQSASHNVP